MALQRRIRAWLIFFIVALVLSGVTAFPLVTETRLLSALLHDSWAPVEVIHLVDRVHLGLAVTGEDFPFIAYGSDWLAFAHLVIAMAFWGPLRDPVCNVWVVEWAMLCCVAIIPLALIAGPIRGIPFGWQLIDMSFGVLGLIPLAIIRRDIKRLTGRAVVRAPAG